MTCKNWLTCSYHLPSHICQTGSSEQLLWCSKTGHSPTRFGRNCRRLWLLGKCTHATVNGSQTSSAPDGNLSSTHTLFIFCRSWISVSWRAAKQRLKGQIKGNTVKVKTLESKKPRQMQWIGGFFLGGKNPVGKAKIWNTQILHCFSWGEMSRFVSQFVPWTNEIFWGLFNFQLNDMSKKEEGESPSQGLMLFHNVLSRNWKRL